MVKSLEQLRRYVDPAEQPKMAYYFELYNGTIGEAESPLHLFDLLADPNYSDCDDRVTHVLLLNEMLRDVAAMHLSALQVRAKVVTGAGVLYDNGVPKHQDEMEEASGVTFRNADDPVILDSWDEWTVMASLVRSGYLSLYEKVPTFGVKDQNETCTGCHFFNPESNTCSTWQATDVLERMVGCPFWTKNENPSDEYRMVDPDDLPVEPHWRPGYVSISERM